MRKTKKRTYSKKRTTRRYKKRNSKRKPVKRRRTRKRRVMKGGGNGNNTPKEKKAIQERNEKRREEKANREKAKREKANKDWKEEKELIEKEKRRINKIQRAYPGPPYNENNLMGKENTEWANFIKELQNEYEQKMNKDLLAYPEYKELLERDFYTRNDINNVTFDDKE